MSDTQQVFARENKRTWKYFKTSLYVFSIVFGCLLVVAIYSITTDEKYRLPKNMQQLRYIKLSDNELFNKVVGDKNMVFSRSLSQVRDSLEKNRQVGKPNAVAVNAGITLPVRAGFFVNWDPQSYASLHDNIDKMNLILTESFFVQDISDEIFIDTSGDAMKANSLIKKYNKPALAMVSNYFNEKFNGDNVKRIIHDNKKTDKLINSIVAGLKKYGLKGVNIDFEEINEKSDEYLITFQRKLYTRLHALGYLVSQDVAPFNDDYNYKELAAYNDLLFLMAYDLHNSESTPGPIAPSQWVENALDNMSKKVDPDKIVLCIAAYGYDWPQGCKAENATYEELVTLANENDTLPVFDTTDYNLNFTYEDDENVTHTVYLTDAATDYNTMRTSEDFGVAGVAMWRLGSEDPRIWNFYNKSLDLDSLNHRSAFLDSLNVLNLPQSIDYEGEGEILNILSEPSAGKISVEVDSAEKMISAENYESLPAGYVVGRSGQANKKIVLTFDDGPDADWTPKVLAVLKKYNVPAAFFVTGASSQSNIHLLKQEYDMGYEIGNHTYSHINMEVASDKNAVLELRSTRRIIEAVTGHSTLLFRAPYSSDAEPTTLRELHPLMTAKKEGFLDIGASIDPRDWEKGVVADTILKRAIAEQGYGNIILLHDAGGDRTETIKALPRIIEYYRAHGYEFISLSQLMGKTRAQLMPEIVGNRNKSINTANYGLILFIYWQQHFFFWLFMIALVLTLFKVSLNAFLATRKKIDLWLKRKMPGYTPNVYPMVSIIVPAYNEEVNILKTIKQLLRSTYPNFEVIVVDDGSKDNTLKVAQEAYGASDQVVIVSKMNGGKATAINTGIEHSKGAFLFCIDGDTNIKEDALTCMVAQMMESERIGAIAGNVRVGNKVNLLTNWQAIEYTTSQNFERLAFDSINAVMVIPGAIGLFRKSAIDEVGPFVSDTVAEDCDMTMRLLKAGYTITTCNDAIAMTEAPESLNNLMKQRRRWTFGILQCFWKNRKYLFGKKYKNMGWVVLPNILIFQMILPLFAPLVDFALVISLLFGKTMETILLYVLYMLVDFVIATVAYAYDKQKIRLVDLLMIIPQRIIYRQILFIVLLQTYLHILKGELMQWGVLKRTGNAHAANI